MTKYIKSVYGGGDIHGNYTSVITPGHLCTKENRALNRLLGINVINYIGNKNPQKNEG